MRGENCSAFFFIFLKNNACQNESFGYFEVLYFMD